MILILAIDGILSFLLPVQTRLGDADSWFWWQHSGGFAPNQVKDLIQVVQFS